MRSARSVGQNPVTRRRLNDTIRETGPRNSIPARVVDFRHGESVQVGIEEAGTRQVYAKYSTNGGGTGIATCDPFAARKPDGRNSSLGVSGTRAI